MVPDTAVIINNPVLAAAAVYLIVGSVLSFLKLDTDSKICLLFWILLSYTYGAGLSYIMTLDVF